MSVSLTRQILAFLADREPATEDEIVAAVGADPTAVAAVLADLGGGTIRRDPDGYSVRGQRARDVAAIVRVARALRRFPNSVHYGQIASVTGMSLSTAQRTMSMLAKQGAAVRRRGEKGVYAAADLDGWFERRGLFIADATIERLATDRAQGPTRVAARGKKDIIGVDGKPVRIPAAAVALILSRPLSDAAVLDALVSNRHGLTAEELAETLEAPPERVAEAVRRMLDARLILRRLCNGQQAVRYMPYPSQRVLDIVKRNPGQAGTGRGSLRVLTTD